MNCDGRGIDLNKQTIFFFKNYNNIIDYIASPSLFRLGGGIFEKCDVGIGNRSNLVESLFPMTEWEGMVTRHHDSFKNLNVEESIDPSKKLISQTIHFDKLIVPLVVDRSLYKTHEELYSAVKEWWIKSPDKTNAKKARKGHGIKTITNYIRHARAMEKHPIYPVDWFEFEPTQVINQLLYRQLYEYPEKAKNTENPNYGVVQLTNFWKTVRCFATAFGIDVSFYPWRPPEIPEHQKKKVPRPKIVNILIHYNYSNNKNENALIKTLLTVGFQSGVRPETLIVMKINWIDSDDCTIDIREQKKKWRERQVWVEPAVMHSHQQNSLKNWIEIWRPRIANEHSGEYLFIKPNGKPFTSEDDLRRYLSKRVKPVWNHFKPKIMRDWNAIARLIRTKIETGKWDIYDVKEDLGHKKVTTTENYVKYSKKYYRNDKYDWLRAVLKFHPDSNRMQKLMKQDYRSSQEILTNEKNKAPEGKNPPVEPYGPGGIRTRDL